MLRTVTATRYVTPLREGGSLPGVVEADDDGLYVVKFRGAGQGRKALVAEVLVGGLARELGLPVPEMVLVDLDPALGHAEPDPEIQELITGSGGINFGMDFLPGALDYSAARPETVSHELASAVVWFDALTTNVDRTPRNPNLLLWHGSPWLIDHGAALYQHHGGDLAKRAREPFSMIADHVLLPVATAIAAADARLSPSLTAAVLAGVLEEIPDEWLAPEDPAAARAVYAEYFAQRLLEPRAFAAEAERVHGA